MYYMRLIRLWLDKDIFSITITNSDSMLGLADKKTDLPYSEEIKALGKRYKCLPRADISILL